MNAATSLESPSAASTNSATACSLRCLKCQNETAYLTRSHRICDPCAKENATRQGRPKAVKIKMNKGNTSRLLRDGEE